MGLQGANKSAHWDGWEMENPSSCNIANAGQRVWRVQAIKHLYQFN